MLHATGIERRFTPAIAVGELAGVASGTLESCHSIWVFDPERMRFRRVPRGASVEMPATAEDWQPYYRLEVNPETGAFAVGLNQDGTRMLRSWLHVEPCPHCPAGSQTEELTLDAVRPR